jgi:hypothetical protein
MLLTVCLAACPLSGTGEGTLCIPCTLCLFVLGESGQVVSGCWVGEAISSCSLWQWYWRCAYRVVVPFCLVGYPLWVALWARGFRLWWRWRPFHQCDEGVLCLGSSMRDMLPCVVRFLGRALDSVHWGLISSRDEGVGTMSETWPWVSVWGSVVIIKEAGYVCGSRLGVSTTEDWLTFKVIDSFPSDTSCEWVTICNVGLPKCYQSYYKSRIEPIIYNITDKIATTSINRGIKVPSTSPHRSVLQKRGKLMGMSWQITIIRPKDSYMNSKLVGATHGSLGQWVSFSLIDAGSVFLLPA